MDQHLLEVGAVWLVGRRVEAKLHGADDAASNLAPARTVFPRATESATF